jgi:hypothetical protein
MMDAKMTMDPHATENQQASSPKPSDMPATESTGFAFGFAWGMPSLALALLSMGILIIGWAGAAQPAIATAGALAGIAGIAAFVCGFIIRRLDTWAWAGLGLAILVLLAIPLAVDHVNLVEHPPQPQAPANNAPFRIP